MKRMFTLLATAAMAATSAWAGYFSPEFVSTDIPVAVTGYGAENLVDGKYSAEADKWFASASKGGAWKGGYVIMDAGKIITLQGYRLIAGHDTYTYQNRRWKSWKLYGSNSSDADGEWALLDQKTDSPTSATNFGVDEYTVPVSKAYRYYKLVVDDCASGDEIQMSEMQLAGEAASIVITFDANEGEGTMASQTIEGSGTLTANTLTREGYTFAGWNTAADGTGTAYTDEQAITVTSETKGAFTLYAQWEASTSSADYYTWLFSNTTLENSQLADGGVILSNVGDMQDVMGSTFIRSATQLAISLADGKVMKRIVITSHEFSGIDPTKWIVEQTANATWTNTENYVVEWTGEATSVGAGYYSGYIIDKIEVWVTEGTVTDIDTIDAPKASKAIKTIKTVENGKIVIIKGGVKYDLSGSVIK